MIFGIFLCLTEGTKQRPFQPNLILKIIFLIEALLEELKPLGMEKIGLIKIKRIFWSIRTIGNLLKGKAPINIHAPGNPKSGSI